MSEKQGLNQPPQYAADPQPQVVYVQQQVASVSF